MSSVLSSPEDHRDGAVGFGGNLPPPCRTPPPPGFPAAASSAAFATSGSDTGGALPSPTTSPATSLPPGPTGVYHHHHHHLDLSAERVGAALRDKGTCLSAPPGLLWSSSSSTVSAGVGGVGSAAAGFDLTRGLIGGAGAGSSSQSARGRNGDGGGGADRQHRPTFLHPAAVIGGGGGGDRLMGGGSGGYDQGVSSSLQEEEEDDTNKVRTSSFSNLAAALGEGLAESMDNSLERRQQWVSGVGVGRGTGDRRQMLERQTLERSSLARVDETGGLGSSGPSGSSSLMQPHKRKKNGGVENGGRGIDNMSRQSRHTASRFVGSSRPATAATLIAATHGKDQREGRPGGLEIRFNPTTSAAVVPSRMLSPASLDNGGGGQHGHSASGLSAHAPSFSTESAHAPSPLMVSSSVQPPRANTMTVYASSLEPSPNALGAVARSHNAITVEEPRSCTASPAIGLIAGAPSSGLLPPGAARTVSEDYPAFVGGQQHSRGVEHRERQQSDGGAFLRDAPPPVSRSPRPMAVVDVASCAESPGPSPSPIPDALASQQSVVDAEKIAEVELAPFTWDIGDDVRVAGHDYSHGGASSSCPSPGGQTSRALAVFFASGMYVSDVRSTCEAFGTLSSFRHEFLSGRGILFVTYLDIRSTWQSASELGGCLRRLVTPAAGSRNEVKVRYCVPLNASSAGDESAVLLSNLPHHINEYDLRHVLSSYGAVRSVRPNVADASGTPSFVAEFYDTQDARQALLEIDGMQPWGPDAVVSAGSRHVAERRQGQDLLALLGRWRRTNSAGAGGQQQHVGTALSALAPVQSSLRVRTAAVTARASVDNGPSPSTNSFDSVSPMPQAPDASCVSSSVAGGNRVMVTAVEGGSTGLLQQAVHAQQQQPQPPPTAQLVMGPDGQFSYVMVAPPPSGAHSYNPHHVPSPSVPQYHAVHAPQQQIVHGPHGTYVTSVPAAHHMPVPAHQHQLGGHLGHHPAAPAPVPPQYIIHHTAGLPVAHAAHPPHPAAAHPLQYHQLPPGTVLTAAPAPQVFDGRAAGYAATMPMYAAATPVPQQTFSANGTAASGRRSSGGGQQRNNGGGPRPSGGANDDDASQLLLDIDAVKDRRDMRTSLMVRNIPNKYTQRMLLSEFAELGHGSDRIDFFYLPIDFKNKCNRGYAFVNFVDPADIVPFHSRYNGRRWRVFNSEKICDITYARIQGKEAMMKRFQNSALMGKDDEYRPLVFVSRGPEKGRREDFPSPMAASSSLPLIPQVHEGPTGLSSLAIAIKGKK